MRSTAFPIHNTNQLEAFVKRRRGFFEFWAVGLVKGRRLVLDHHLTHDDLETNLAYAEPGDLGWRDVAESDIPTEKNQNALEMEETIKHRIFWDYESWPEKAQRSVAGHFGSIA